MPMLNELRRRLLRPAAQEIRELEGSEEMLVCDARSGMRSTQIIDDKFGVALSREHDRLELETDCAGGRCCPPPKG